jgi:hypothetical protein
MPTSDVLKTQHKTGEVEEEIGTRVSGIPSSSSSFLSFTALKRSNNKIHSSAKDRMN